MYIYIYKHWKQKEQKYPDNSVFLFSLMFSLPHPAALLMTTELAFELIKARSYNICPTFIHRLAFKSSNGSQCTAKLRRNDNKTVEKTLAGNCTR